MQKALTEMNIQLHKVVRDITAVTGMHIIKTIPNRELDPVELAKMQDPRLKGSTETIGKALEGDYRGRHQLTHQSHKTSLLRLLAMAVRVTYFRTPRTGLL